MGQSGETIARGMAVSVHKFSLVRQYLDCGCTTSNDTTSFKCFRMEGSQIILQQDGKTITRWRILQTLYRGHIIGVVSWRESGKKVSVLCQPIQKYFNYPAATEVRSGRAAINLERRFHQFIWETTFCDGVNNKGMLSRE